MTGTPTTESSTWTFACRNHPTYRWTKNKCGPGFIGRGVLIFEGDLATGKPSDPFGTFESEIARRAPEDQAHYRARYTPQCDCRYSDLYVVAKEYQPFPVA